MLKVGAIGSLVALRFVLSKRNRGEAASEPDAPEAAAPPPQPAHPVSRRKKKRRRRG
jgi:hypothetical protein